MNVSEYTSGMLYGSYFERKWNSLIDNTTENTYVWFVLILNLSTPVTYWGVGSIYLLLDWTKRPKWIQRYRIRDKKDKELDMKTLILIAKTVLFNQVIVQISFASLVYPLLVLLVDPLVALRHVPSLRECLFQLFGFWIFREITFYYFHRLLHYGQFYVLFHKKHHSYTADTAITAEYCTPVEHILTNVGPAVVGPAILRFSFIPLFLWFAHIMLSALQEHSGYHFSWYYNSKRHNSHHHSFNTNYGLIGLMDWIHGT